jgi:hypothetical protein
LEENKNARTTPASPAFARQKDATVGIDRPASERVLELSGFSGTAEFFEATCQVSADRGAARFDVVVRIPADLSVEEFDAMRFPHTDEMLWFAGRCWWFPGARIGAESQFERKNGRASGWPTSRQVSAFSLRRIEC